MLLCVFVVSAVNIHILVTWFGCDISWSYSPVWDFLRILTSYCMLDFFKSQRHFQYFTYNIIIKLNPLVRNSCPSVAFLKSVSVHRCDDLIL